MADIIEANTSGSGDPADVARDVVVPVVSSSDVERVLPWATWLAVCTSAPVHLLGAATHGAASIERRTELETAAEHLRRCGLIVDTLVRETTDFVALVGEVAGDRPGSVICVSVHAPEGRGRATPDPLLRHVVERSRGPVLFVGPHVRQFVEPRRLIAALDGGSASRPIVPLVEAWARALGLEIDVVHVAGPHATSGGVGRDIDVAMAEDVALLGLAADLRRHGLTPSTEVLHSRVPAAAIIEHARRDPPAIVVVATHALRTVPTVARGSVAEQVVQWSPVPVVVAT
jgi:nucleotide-binding universal stress UspA family protein